MLGHSKTTVSARREEPAWSEMRADHSSLAGCAKRTEDLLVQLTLDPTLGEASRAFRILRDFHTRLLDHLEVEERSGVLQQAADAEPRFARRVESLLLEHDELRTRSTQLLDITAGANWAQVHGVFVVFRELLVSHEHAENDVIHGAYLQDLGGRG